MQTPVQNGDSAALQDLKAEVHELKDMVSQLQQQTVASRAEITRLREELERAGTNTSRSVTVDEQSPAYGSATTAQLDQRLDSVEEQQQLLSGKIDDQYQTKVESASKYRVRLSGIVLFNLFGNSGQVRQSGRADVGQRPDCLEFFRFGRRNVAAIDHWLGSFGPELHGSPHQRQRELRFRRRFSGDLQRRGFRPGAVAHCGGSAGLEEHFGRRRAGPLFISPLVPTSFASLIVPPLSYAGNLWAWTPQLRVEHRFALAGRVQGDLCRAGSSINLTGEPPDG